MKKLYTFKNGPVFLAHPVYKGYYAVQVIQCHRGQYQWKARTDFSSFLSQFTRLTDGQTDGRTEFLSLDRVCISCSEVKNTWKEKICNVRGTDAY